MGDYWEDNNIPKPQQIVVCAAVRLEQDGEVYLITGARHFDKVMNNIIRCLPMELKWTNADQGFINQFGEFLTREEAFKVVQENGQPFSAERNRDKKDLFSEGLY
jgi:glutamate racemase